MIGRKDENSFSLAFPRFPQISKKPLDALNLSLCCKRVIVSFILVFAQSTILPMISLSKYKWKVSSMLSILFTLKFGARQLILPEMVLQFRCLPVATGSSELHKIFFVFVFLWIKITTKFFENTIFIDIFDFFVFVFI